MMLYRLVIFFILLIPFFSLANSQVLNVYNWEGYMPESLVQQFEKETGIRVHYIEFNSDEVLYAKLKADPKIPFDIIVPTSYYVQRMIREGMLKKLDKHALTNLKYINPALLNKAYDPQNQYSIPYVWGATGIVVNDRYHNPKDFTDWQDFWKPQYKNQLLMLNDMREVFGMALMSMGHSFNDKNPVHIKAAYEKLKKLLPNIKLFNSDAQDNIYIDEDATLGMGWNGDIHLVQEENPNVKFIFPKTKFAVWLDCLAIPKNAPHYQNAIRFIQFVMRPKIAEEIALYNGYSSPNLAAIKMMPKALQNNTQLNPTPKMLKRAVFEADVGDANKIYEKYWELLQLGG